MELFELDRFKPIGSKPEKSEQIRSEPHMLETSKQHSQRQIFIFDPETFLFLWP